MRVGTKEIPEYRMSQNLLSDLKTLFEKFGRNEIELPTVSEILGHKSPKSGTFLYKTAAFRAYGLVDGRGKIAVTDIGENIAFKKDEVSYNEALIRAVTKVPFWKFLFDKYTKHNKGIKDDEFWLDLKEQCGLTIDGAKKLAPEILKAYRDDTKLINMSLVTVPNSINSATPSNDTDNIQPTPQPSLDVMDIGYKNYKVYLPKDENEQAQVWKRLKKMVDAYISPDDDD